MFLKQLYYFVKVAELGSITLAADALFTTKQSLSEALSKLEQKYSLQFFTRSRSGMKLTDVGESFLLDAVALLKQYEDLNEKYSNIAQETSKIMLAVSCHLASLVMPDALKTLHERNPTVNVQILEFSNNDEAFHALLAHQVDFCLLTFSADYLRKKTSFYYKIHTQLNTINIIEDRLCLLAHQSFPIAKKNGVIYDDYATLPMIGYDSYKEVYPAIGKNQNHPNTFVCMTNDLNTYHQMIYKGIGIGFSTVLLSKELAKRYGNEVNCIPDLTPEAIHTVVIVTQSNSSLPPGSHELIIVLKELFNLL